MKTQKLRPKNKLNSQQQNELLQQDRRERCKRKNEKVTTLLDELFGDDEGID